LPTKRKRDEIDFSDPYVLIDTPHFPGLAETLRQLDAFNGLNSEDARQVAAVIVTDMGRPFGWAGWRTGRLQDPRDMQVALQQHAANIGAGCDVRPWHDRSAASTALGIAADVIAESCAKRSA
jgi:hypothetical protein